MTETTYDVRIWKTAVWKGKTKTTYYVRWTVNKRQFKESFATSALAKSFRSKLVAAMGDGVAFDVESGLPHTMMRNTESATWFDFACAYVDMKWPDISPGHRKSIADSLIPITFAMLKTTPSKTGQKGQVALRTALRRAFNPNTRHEARSEQVDESLRWVSSNTRKVAELAHPDTLRRLLSDLEVNLDGTRAAPDTVRLRRATLTNAIDFAVEQKLLTNNPMNEVKTKKSKNTARQVDRRSVPNPVQARSLLRAVGDTHPQLVAFFALMYFAALRPEEATNLRKQDISLPSEGWGELYLDRATPEVGEEWTDTRTRSEERGLKHRADDAGRPVPCSPELTEILHNHINTYGTASDGRLFRGKRNGGRLPSSVYGRAWARARATTFTPEVTDSLLAKRPYDLRHAAVSTWLNAGVEPTRVAQWAGHSVGVLLRVYAKCLDGGEEAARARVQRALEGR
ncbi:Phage integrase family protein [Actinopolyspora xinjiangensis]|uniref:Phage integrase family protein n=1 Tax=Actinopolyspora xinjiangensis TaxID=405564 RepID=A0A1H0WBZ9_9ACTN|nr:tyrosine-type recombinase/integrase [Actinopolyspora xinjiangensis]SDP87846.1 Phage integrase family protein [Actinopolyspora xinjiangensis]